MKLRESTSAPADQLWKFLGDVEHWGDHLPTFDSVRHVGGPSPAGLGSRFEVRQPGLVKAVYEITRWEPGRGFTWVGRAPGVATTGIHDIAADGDRHDVLLAIEWSGPLAWAVRLLMSSKAHRMMQSEAEHLIALAEQD